MDKYNLRDTAVIIEEDNVSIVYDEEKCINCKICKRTCEQNSKVDGHYELEKTGDIGLCINCGQCIQTCPKDALLIKSDISETMDAINNPKKIVIALTAPAVRVAIGEPFGEEPGAYCEGEMVDALRKIGFDYVLDVTFGADLTIMEEATELIDRIQNNKTMPMFTSCCPAWVKYVETYYPQFINNLSTTKSPISIQTPAIKTYFAEKNNLNPEDIITVSITPCTAKKFEAHRPEYNSASLYNKKEMRDTDISITTVELADMIKLNNINFKDLNKNSEFDQLMERGSGGGIIFGNTGGVAQASIRSAYYFLNQKNPPKDIMEISNIQDLEGVKKITVNLESTIVRIVIVTGINNAKIMLDKLAEGIVEFDFMEVMTCIGGCISGGGQPKVKRAFSNKVRLQRIESLSNKDKDVEIRCSHDNPDIQKLYSEFYTKPLSEISHHMLHTHFISRASDLNKK